MGKIEAALDEAGADAFISKPFTVEELQRKLKKCADKAQLIRFRKDHANRQQDAAQSQPQSSGGWFGKMFS